MFGEDMYLWYTLFYFASFISAEVFTDFALDPMKAAKVGFQKWEDANILEDAVSKRAEKWVRWFPMNEIDKHGP